MVLRLVGGSQPLRAFRIDAGNGRTEPSDCRQSAQSASTITTDRKPLQSSFTSRDVQSWYVFYTSLSG